MFPLPAFPQAWKLAAHISTSNAILRLRPYRKTAKSLSNEMTREMPSRSMSAKEVRSTREKSWSGKRSPIAHAASRSALVVCSMVATPLRNPSQKLSAASAEMKWWIRRQVSTRTWSLVTSGSSVASSCLARPFCRSLRSAAAYQAELSTKILMMLLNGRVFQRPSLPRSFDLSPKRYQMFPTYQDRRRWNGQYFVGSRPSPDQPVGAYIRQVKRQARQHAHELVCATQN